MSHLGRQRALDHRFRHLIQQPIDAIDRRARRLRVR
jgi:hypothetical protein